MLRLCLDQNHGAALIPCPACGRPLLLGANRMGRWLVGYDRGFTVRPGKKVMLVCPAYQCDHTEPVEIVRSPTDAVVFDPYGAACRFTIQQRAYGRTLDELREEIRQLNELYRERPHPKLIAAVRFWIRKYHYAYNRIVTYLERSNREGQEVLCEGTGLSERGKVAALLPDSLLLERTENSETVLLRFGDLSAVYFTMDWGAPRKFDFSEPGHRFPHLRSFITPRRYVVIAGHAVSFERITHFGMCTVRTPDPEIARDLKMMPLYEDDFSGEFPAWMIERCYRAIRHYHVNEHRLYLSSFTNDPDVFQLGTRDMAVARALHMGRAMMWVGQRKALRWLGYFHRREISKTEERQVPFRLPLQHQLK